MPGSLNACQLACTRLIFPELGHLVKHLKGA
jgi:molybdenum cofactor biosynthesis protein B